jgi:hypothetical protein
MDILAQHKNIVNDKPDRIIDLVRHPGGQAPEGRHLLGVHQALLGFAVAGGGTSPATNRDLGARLLGAFMTQGVGADVWVASGLSLSVTVSTGYPVWLRPELALRYRF